MKLKDINGLRAKAAKELKELLKEKENKAVQAKVRIKVAKEKNLKHVKMLRRDIAQISTILREKELAEGIMPEDEKAKKVI